MQKFMLAGACALALLVVCPVFGQFGTKGGGGGGVGRPPYKAAVSTTSTTLTVPAITHSQNTDALIVSCYNAAGTALALVNAGPVAGQYSVTVNTSSKTVTIAFGASNQNGWCVVNGGGSPGAPGAPGGGGLPDPGSNGIPYRDSGGTTRLATGADLPTVPANKLPSTISSDTTGTAAKATALAASPSPCPEGQFVTALAADGTPTCSTPTGGGAPVSSRVSLPALATLSHATTD